MSFVFSWKFSYLSLMLLINLHLSQFSLGCFVIHLYFWGNFAFFLPFISWAHYEYYFSFFCFSFPMCFWFSDFLLKAGFHILIMLYIEFCLECRHSFSSTSWLFFRAGEVLPSTSLCWFVWTFISWFSSMYLHRFYSPFVHCVMLDNLWCSFLSVWQRPVLQLVIWLTFLFIWFGGRENGSESSKTVVLFYTPFPSSLHHPIAKEPFFIPFHLFSSPLKSYAFVKTVSSNRWPSPKNNTLTSFSDLLSFPFCVFRFGLYLIFVVVSPTLPQGPSQHPSSS